MNIKVKVWVAQMCPTMSPHVCVCVCVCVCVTESLCSTEEIDTDCKQTMKVLLAHSCLPLCNPMDCSPPGSSVHGIFQARILEWAAIPFSRGSSRPRDQTKVSWTASRFFTIWATTSMKFTKKKKKKIHWTLTLSIEKLDIQMSNKYRSIK